MFFSYKHFHLDKLNTNTELFYYYYFTSCSKKKVVDYWVTPIYRIEVRL